MLHRVRTVALVAGMALLAGCGVTQSQLDAQMNQRMTEMHSYVDQKVSASETATRKDLADAKATSQAALAAVQSQESVVRLSHDTLRDRLEAESQALDQEKRTVDALLERLKASQPATSAPAAK